ncbi:MAG: hypothetical protein C0403_04845 [Desulfobacterium sp.]|nr:hypothetical protein [Desulfobacterium sp.]
MTPANAQAALSSLQYMLAEPERVLRLQENAKFFNQALIDQGLDVGTSKGQTSVVPCIVGGSIRALKLSEKLFEQGINVQPIVYPVVADKSARLRFFLSSTHTNEQLERTAREVKESLEYVTRSSKGLEIIGDLNRQKKDVIEYKPIRNDHFDIDYAFITLHTVPSDSMKKMIPSNKFRILEDNLGNAIISIMFINYIGGIKDGGEKIPPFKNLIIAVGIVPVCNSTTEPLMSMYPIVLFIDNPDVAKFVKEIEYLPVLSDGFSLDVGRGDLAGQYFGILKKNGLDIMQANINQKDTLGVDGEEGTRLFQLIGKESENVFRVKNFELQGIFQEFSMAQKSASKISFSKTEEIFEGFSLSNIDTNPVLETIINSTHESATISGPFNR